MLKERLPIASPESIMLRKIHCTYSHILISFSHNPGGFMMFISCLRLYCGKKNKNKKRQKTFLYSLSSFVQFLFRQFSYLELFLWWASKPHRNRPRLCWFRRLESSVGTVNDACISAKSLCAVTMDRVCEGMMEVMRMSVCQWHLPALVVICRWKLEICIQLGNLCRIDASFCLWADDMCRW